MGDRFAGGLAGWAEPLVVRTCERVYPPLVRSPHPRLRRFPGRRPDADADGRPADRE
jgi:hypothetical protein